MRDKAKMLLLPFNLVWLALILASNFDLGDTASNFDEDGVLKESRIKRLEQIAEIDNSTGMPRGGLSKESATSSNRENYMELINLIINCKTFMADLHSKGSEGSLLDIYSFMENASSLNFPKSLFNVTALKSLKIIFNLSKIQSKEMDKAILEVIYNQHLKNKRLSKEYKNVIVEGDGTVGFYAAFELFMEGMNVTLLNNRSDDNTRKRFIFFDGKWMPQLRFILGTEFMMERLKNLSNYIIKKEGNQPGKSFLNLIYNTAVLDINTDYEKHLAILGAQVNSPQSFDFGHLKQILTNYEGMTILESDKTIAIPFDLIFCDFIKQIKYGAVILNKSHNKKIFKENHMLFKINFMDDNLLLDFERFVKEAHFLSRKIRYRYYYILKLICNGMKEVKDDSKSPLTRTGKVYKTVDDVGLLYNDNSNDSENISVQIFETETNIKLKAKIPMAIVELIEEVKIEREEFLNDLEMLKEYNDFIVELKERWFRAVLYHLLKNNSEDNKKVIVKLSNETFQVMSSIQILYFEKNSLFGKPFLLKIYGKENAVKLVNGKKDSAIFVNINTEDINEGFIDVENAVFAIKKYKESSEQKDLEGILLDALKKP
uniref:Uncharacterized protein n=1 Tax=Meloidogyne enterolobii TaxID=390850 RepID=A0A6V7UBL0_MELEN|nr:unnamed protein product [Meloidogyne enterolobii]